MPDDLLAPPAEGEGVQFSMSQVIQSGEDIEYCQFVQAPEEGMWVNQQIVRYTPGSHHVLLMSTPYDEPPEDAPTGVFECDGFGDFDVTSLVAGAQSQNSAFMENYPPDVAHYVAPGAWLIMNTHYLNTAAQALEAEARINVYTIDEADVRERAGALFWYNFVVSVDPMASGTTNMRCPITEEITILDMQSHMHARGSYFQAHLLDSMDGEQVELLYENDQWEDVPVKEWADGDLVLEPGQWINWQCEYENPENRWITQGAKATDEMCVLFASYYPYDENQEFCSTEDGIDNWMLKSEIRGIGDRTCDETLTCLIIAEDLFNADYQKCILDSCVSSGHEVTELVKCHANDGYEAECDGDLDCLLEACDGEISACQEAVCE